MGDVKECQLNVRAEETQSLSPPPSESKQYKWWILVALYTFSILSGQTIATLLCRFYYNQGGNSKWLPTIVTSAGFPILLPFLFFPSSTSTPRPPLRKLALPYILMGIITSLDNLMYSYGLLYLPVSTYSLVCATQLAFNVLFSYFLNSQKFTALIINSVVLVTFSAALLAVSSEDDTHVPKSKYPLGFIFTLAASATFSLLLSLTQLIYQRVLKTQSFFVIIQMLVCTSFVATSASIVGLFASGEWVGIGREMEGFENGKVSYVLTLVSIAVCWQICSIGIVGLIFVVSSLFCNMICAVGLPLVPIFAVVFFQDKMDGVKVMAMLIAIWGFLSYIYQDYVDCEAGKKREINETLCSEMNEVS